MNIPEDIKSLYEKLKDDKELSSLSEETLVVAKNIPEIKKEYSIIMRGISETLNYCKDLVL